MARRFVESEEAAKMLGVTTETLNEMRERHELSAYRDGGRWKYKSDEIEKLIAERGAKPGTDPAEPEFADLDENLDSILLSEVELGQSSASTSSTVIGKTNAPSPDSDIELAKPKKPDRGSDLATSMSDVRLAGSGSEVLSGGPGLSSKFDDLDALDLDLEPAGGSKSGSKGAGSKGADAKGGDSKGGGSKAGSSKGGPAKGGSSTKVGASGISGSRVTGGAASGSGLSFADDGLDLGEEDKTAKPASGAGGSAIDLAGGQDDDDLVLGSGSSGSDLTHSAGDSGISLVDPADSGLSLEEPPAKLGGSAVESLELSDDDMVLLEEEAAEPEAATQLKADDDFLLTPLEDAGEESDSGSQVIALDSDVEFDDSASTMVGAAAPSALLEEDLGAGFGAAAPTMGTAPSARAGLGVAAGAVAPEAPYSIWNIMSLAVCLVCLMTLGMMMYDNLRNMWSWNGAYSVDSSIMDTVLKWFN